MADAHDNAMMESFVSTLKRELVHLCLWPTRQAARTAIFDHIGAFYNRSRLHSAIDYVSLEEFEEAGTLTKLA